MYYLFLGAFFGWPEKNRIKNTAHEQTVTHNHRDRKRAKAGASKSIDFFLFGDISLELGEISPLFFFLPDLRRMRLREIRWHRAVCKGRDRSGVVLVLWCVILVIKMTILQFQ